MDSLKFFAGKNNLQIQLFAGDEYDIPGREGCIRVIDDQFGIELDDQTCIPGKVADGFVRIVTFNPDDVLEVNLALELIEVSGQRELTCNQRRKKVRLLRRLRKSEILRLFAQKHGLKTQRSDYGLCILGRTGRIVLTDGCLGLLVNDQTCIQDDPDAPISSSRDGIFVIPIFNPEDEPQAKLALEVIETTGLKELTREERKKKLELLEQLRMAEPQEEEHPSARPLAHLWERRPSLNT